MNIENIPKTVSTHKLIVSDTVVRFTCPNCGKGTIIRSNRERRLGLEWVCPACGYKGP